jgi:competence protein ComEC
MEETKLENNYHLTQGWTDLAFYGISSFLTGVLAAGLAVNFYLALASAVCLGAILFFVTRLKLRFMEIFLILTCLFLGFFYYHFRINLEVTDTNLTFGNELTFSGIVINEPQIRNEFQISIIKVQEPLSGKVRLITKPFPELEYGDEATLRGSIEPNSNGVGKVALSFYPDVIKVDRSQGFILKRELLRFKHKLVGIFGNYLESDRAALLSGLTFGVRADFSKELKDQMATSGTTHLVALSGYNIAILVLAVAGVFGYFLSRRLTFLITSTLIAVFVIMVGAEASVLRAAVMGFMVLMAHEAGRVYDMRNAIAATALIMVIVSPVILINDLGFILSFTSLLGIVYLGPALKKLFKFENKAEGFLSWRETFITTLSAQLAVLPIILQNFGSFNLFSVIANILILAFVPFTMFLGFLLAGLGLFSYYIGFLVAQVLNILLSYELGVIKFFSYFRFQLPGAFTGIIIFMLYYFTLAVISVKYARNKNEKT